MAKKPETVFWDRIRPKLNAIPYSYFEKIQQVSKRSTPDVLACVRGLFFGIELKRNSKEKPDPLQRHSLDRIDKACGVSIVLHPENWEYWYKKILRYAKGETNVI
jgi:hypothetical protein